MTDLPVPLLSRAGMKLVPVSVLEPVARVALTVGGKDSLSVKASAVDNGETNNQTLRIFV